MTMRGGPMGEILTTAEDAGHFFLSDYVKILGFFVEIFFEIELEILVKLFMIFVEF